MRKIHSSPPFFFLGVTALCYPKSTIALTFTRRSLTAITSNCRTVAGDRIALITAQSRSALCNDPSLLSPDTERVKKFSSWRATNSPSLTSRQSWSNILTFFALRHIASFLRINCAKYKLILCPLRDFLLDSYYTSFSYLCQVFITLYSISSICGNISFTLLNVSIAWAGCGFFSALLNSFCV